MVINDFVSAMQSKDHEALAACFAEECRLFDYCPSVVKRQNSFSVRPQRHRDVLPQQVHVRSFGMLDPRVVNERTVNFYADYNGTIIHALAQIENCTDGSCSLDDSLIRELVISRRKSRRPLLANAASPVPAGRSLFSGPHGERAPRVCQITRPLDARPVPGRALRIAHGTGAVA